MKAEMTTKTSILKTDISKVFNLKISKFIEKADHNPYLLMMNTIVKKRRVKVAKCRMTKDIRIIIQYMILQLNRLRSNKT